MPKKTIDDYFRDWFHEPFGFGYGTGERLILEQLVKLTELLHWNPSGENYTYDYSELEHGLGQPIAWLLINALCKSGDIDYGTSPRFGWFYGARKRLIDYIKSHTVGEMYEIVGQYDENYTSCFDDYCSCGNEQVHHRCKINPFWNDKPLERSTHD